MISHTRQEWFELAVCGLAGQGPRDLTWPADIPKEGEIK